MKYAGRLKYLEDDSFVRAMDVVKGDGIISFAAGAPDAKTYPLGEIEKSIGRVIDSSGDAAFSYCATRGQLELRDKVSRRMEDIFGIKYDTDEIIITNGSQQGLDMSGMLFIDKGDIVLFESPSYLGAINALRAYEAQLVAVPTDNEGMCIDELKDALDKYGERISMIYVNPDYQNPTGRCWSDERRQEFMALVGDYDIPVLEDGAYSELSFDGQRKKPLAYYDPKGQVVYIGTFSKTFCPGFRVAWMCARKNLMEKYMVLKNASDLSSSAMFQLAIADYMEHNDYDQHIRRIGELYKRRCNVMAASIDEYFPKGCSYVKPQGGLFIWVELPEDMDALKLLRMAEQKGVAFVPGASFYTSDVKKNHMRLNYSNMDEEDIRRGIKILGEVIREYK